MRSGTPCWALVAAAIFVVSPLRADDAGEAKAMFDHGLDEMKRGNLDAACPAFAESYKRNPLPGALFTLAECEAKRGRIATAVKRYEEYLALYATLAKDKLAKQRGRDTQSKDQITLLLPQIPKVTLLVPATLSDAAREGLVITIDGVPIDRASLGAPIPIDPGDHVVFAQARGGSPVETRFTVARSDRKTLPIELATKPGSAVEEAPAGSMGPLRIAGIAAGAAGVVALAIGAVTGGMALGKKGVIQKNCVLDDATGVASCNPAGLAAGRSVATLGGVSTGMFIAGGALAGGGVALFVMGRAPATKDNASSSSLRAKPVFSFGPDHAFLGAEGAF